MELLEAYGKLTEKVWTPRCLAEAAVVE